MGVDEAKKIVDDTLNTELSSKGFLPGLELVPYGQ